MIVIDKISIGIDPGSSTGAISVIMESGNRQSIKHFRFDKSHTEVDFYDFLEGIVKIVDKETKLVCAIEKVNSMPNQSSKATFTFAENFGMLKLALYALKIPYKLVTPQTWMRAYVVPSKWNKISTEEKVGKTEAELVEMEKRKKASNIRIREEHKRKLKTKAQQLYPEEKIINVLADSILIADYAKNYI